MSDPKIKIFLADDDDDDREFFSTALESLNYPYELTMANNGERVIDYFKAGENIPDLVFLDINMPKADGIECLVKIRELYPVKGPVVIMLSTSSSEKTIALSRQYGASIYIEKPNQFNQLIRFLDYCLHDLKNAAPGEEFLLNTRLKGLVNKV